MTQQMIDHMHKDIETLKNDISIIKHILSQEGKISASARKALEHARATPDDEYINHEELKERVHA